jgi:hypothetical protein
MHGSSFPRRPQSFLDEDAPESEDEEAAMFSSASSGEPEAPGT